MADRKNSAPRGAIALLKREFSKFWSDPLGYAIEHWVSVVLLAIALEILASAVKMLYSAGMSIVG